MLSCNFGFSRCFLPLSGVLTIVLSACATGPSGRDFPRGTRAPQKVEELRARIEEGRANQTDWISPSEFEKAEEALSRAESELKSGAGKTGESVAWDDALDDAAKAAAHLDQVDANVKKVARRITPVLESRQAALEVQAEDFSSNEFELADQKLRRVGLKIESDELGADSGAKDFAILEKHYSEMELRSLKAIRLGAIQVGLAKWERSGARQKAPITFAAAEASLASAMIELEANPRNPDAYETRVREASEKSRKLEEIMSAIEARDLPEATALQSSEVVPEL